MHRRLSILLKYVRLLRIDVPVPARSHFRPWNFTLSGLFWIFISQGSTDTQENTCICRMMNEILGIIIHFVLYFGIIALVGYFIYTVHDNIENYFDNKVVWITGEKSPSVSTRTYQRAWLRALRKSRLVLGASSGIGREIAKELARRCPSVSLVLSARRDKELDSLAAELNLDPSRCLVLPLDLERHQQGFDSKLELVLERFGHLDVLINNAGISQRSLIKDTVYTVDSRLISINYLGTVTLSKMVLPVTRALVSTALCFIRTVLAFRHTSTRTLCGGHIRHWLRWHGAAFLVCCFEACSPWIFWITSLGTCSWSYRCDHGVSGIRQDGHFFECFRGFWRAAQENGSENKYRHWSDRLCARYPCWCFSPSTWDLRRSPIFGGDLSASLLSPTTVSNFATNRIVVVASVDDEFEIIQMWQSTQWKPFFQ